MNDNFLPTHIGIGCRRCASSWIHKILDYHPEITKKKNGGIHFFTDNWGNGVDWYKQQFISNNKVKIDFSVSYSYPENIDDVIFRIKKHISNIKIFIIIRNPVDRAYSDYLRSIRMGEVKKNLNYETINEKHPEFLLRGLYANIIKKYIAAFDQKNIKVFFYDDIDKNPDLFAKNLFSYLNVEKIDIPDSLIKPNEPKSKNLKYVTINKLLISTKLVIDSIIRAINLYGCWSDFKLKFLKCWHQILGLNHKEDKIDETLKNKFKTYYKQDIAELEKVLKINLKNWN
jgi:hypothetical protein